jgi:hypothetical protein
MSEPQVTNHDPRDERCQVETRAAVDGRGETYFLACGWPLGPDGSCPEGPHSANDDPRAERVPTTGPMAGKSVAEEVGEDLTEMLHLSARSIRAAVEYAERQGDSDG